MRSIATVQQRLFVLLLATMILAGCTASPQQPAETPTPVAADSPQPTPTQPIPISIGYTLATSNLAVVIGIEEGIYADAGFAVTPSLYAGGAEMNEAMAAGVIHVSLPGLLPAVQAWNVGLSTHPIGLANQGAIRYRMWARNGLGIESIQDLEGQSIAIQEGTDTQLAFLLALEANGMDPSDLTIVNMPWTEMPAALSQDLVDAALTSEPTGTVIETTMIDEVVPLGDLSEYFTGAVLYMVSGQWLDQNPEAVDDLLAAHLRSMQYVREDPERSAALLAEFQGGSATTESVLAQMQLLDFSTAAISDRVVEDTVRVVQFLIDTGRIDEDPGAREHVSRYQSLYEQVVSENPSLAD